MTERQEEKIKRESLTAEVEHKVKQQLSQVLNDAQVNCLYSRPILLWPWEVLLLATDTVGVASIMNNSD